MQNINQCAKNFKNIKYFSYTLKLLFFLTKNIILYILYKLLKWRIQVKHLYKFIALLFIFAFSIFIFKDEIPDATQGKTIATSLQDSTFPVISLKLGKYTVNTIQGYSSSLDSGNIRESITPLDTSKSFNVKKIKF